MKKPLLKTRFLAYPLMASALCLALAFNYPEAKTVARPVSTPVVDSLDELVMAAAMYDKLQLGAAGLSREAFDNALAGWDRLKDEGRLPREQVMAIADFSKSSNQKRLFVLDMKSYSLLFQTLVAHGRNSGKEWATRFSNKLSSFQSSPGFYITGQTYHGGNGYSLKLDGIEKGINDQAMKRAIVMHGAGYVSEKLIRSQGYLGRSLGCPAVPLREAKSIIDTLKGGACLYIHVPDQGYVKRSPILRGSMG